MLFRIPRPDLQIDFALSLGQARPAFLQDALAETVSGLDIGRIDRELGDMVPGPALAALAGRGLRGELMFPVPVVLTANPRLLGYYRLLYGHSQKVFYTQATRMTGFKGMEDRGALTDYNRRLLPELCRNLIQCGVDLLDGIGAAGLSRALLDDLTLLTVGPQLRGGTNVKIGTAGIARVFAAIHGIVRDSVVAATPSRIEIRNAADCPVLIEFAPDPDIIIRVEMARSVFRNVIAIEVKGGTDFSNIHNRIGEAEKSHQKARGKDYAECWTVVNVDRIDLDMARRESPTTNRFYRLSGLEAKSGEEYEDFWNRIVSLTGIKASRVT